MKTAAWLITGGTFMSTSGPEIDDYDIELDTHECERLNIVGNGHGKSIPLVPAMQWQKIETAHKEMDADLAEGFEEVIDEIWPVAWRDIKNAPTDKTVIVGWRDDEDEEDPRRITYDKWDSDEETWLGWANEYDHAACCAPPGCPIPSETAPYEWYLAMPELPDGA